MRSSVTITQVAERAGVGVATVSRVLNSSPAVSAKRRASACRGDRRARLRPSAAARALSTGRTRTVGVVTPFFTQRRSSSACAASRARSPRGYQLVLFDLAGPTASLELPVGGRIDGLLCVSMCPSAADLRAPERRRRRRRAGRRRAPELVERLDRRRRRRPARRRAPARARPPPDRVRRRRRGAAPGASHPARAGGSAPPPRSPRRAARLIVRRGPHGAQQARALAARLLALDDRRPRSSPAPTCRPRGARGRRGRRRRGARRTCR